MPRDRIEKLLERIQKLRSEQQQAIEATVFLGLTPKVARECEIRRKVMSRLVDRLAVLCALPRGAMGAGLHGSSRGNRRTGTHS